MRKTCALLACLAGCLLSGAQAVNTVSFTFAADPLNNVTFTNTSVLQTEGTKKAFWTFGDGTATTTAPLAGTIHRYANAGTYQACLKIFRYNATNPADSVLLGAECKTVTLAQHCEAGFQWTDSVGGNPPAHYVKFSGAGNNNAGKTIAEVCWTFGDGTDTCLRAAAGTQPPLNLVHKYAQNGTYTACLRIKYDGGCVAEKCATVALNAAGTVDSCNANVTVQPVTATPLGRRFVAQPWHSNGKKPVRICWTFGDGKDTCIFYPANYTGGYVAEHRYAAYGSYQVCTSIQYDGGCEKKRCQTIAVVAPAHPDDTCRLDLHEAAANTVSRERRFYLGLMPNKTAEKVCWSFGDGTDSCVVLTTPLNPQQLVMAHRYAAPGTYNVCARVTYAGGCTVQRCRSVSVTVAHSSLCGGYMTDSVINAHTLRFRGTGVQNPGDYVTTYNWTFGDGTTASGQTVTHVFAAPGRYNVCLFLRTAAGCETKICNPVSIAGNRPPQLVLTPNPVAALLTATFVSPLQQTVSVKIYNANGLMVRSYTRAANAGTNTWSFTDVGTLPTGVYSVIVQSASQLATAIFFKQ